MKRYVVIDVEMCYVPKSCRTYQYHWKNEIIQIGAVLLDEAYQITDTFNMFVKPRYGRITPFISNLTGITGHDVQDAEDIENVLETLWKWIPSDAAVVTWSETDKYQFLHEIKGKDLDISEEMLLDRVWIDCQKMFDDKIQAVNSSSLKNALILSDIDYDENLHNGLTDAYNTALLFTRLQTEPDFALNAYYVSAHEDMRQESIGTSLTSLLSGLNIDVSACAG